MSLNDPNIQRLLKVSRSVGVRHWHTAIMKFEKTKPENRKKAKWLRDLGVRGLFVNNFYQVEEILKSIMVEKPLNNDVGAVTLKRF